jgi:hypothetical protein
MVGRQNEQIGAFMKLTLIPAVEQVDSAAAISAPTQEKFRMKAQRYQRGSLTLRKRRNPPDVWEFRHYEQVGNKAVYKKQIVGKVIEFPKRKDAEKGSRPAPGHSAFITPTQSP